MAQTLAFPRVHVPLAIAAFAWALLSLAMELAWIAPLRLPGHRSLPVALALVLGWHALPRLGLLLAALGVAVVAALGAHDAVLLAVWLVPSAFLATQAVSKWPWLLAGILCGATRGLLGGHHGHSAMQVAAHVGFGLAGALMGQAAWQMTSLHSPGTRNE